MEVDLGQKFKWMKIRNKKNLRTDPPLSSQYDAMSSDDESGPIDSSPMIADPGNKMGSVEAPIVSMIPNRTVDVMEDDEVVEDGVEVQYSSSDEGNSESEEGSDYTLEPGKRRKIPKVCAGNFVTLTSIAVVGTFLAAAIVLFLRNSGFGSKGRATDIVDNRGGDVEAVDVGDTSSITPGVPTMSPPVSFPSNIAQFTASPTSANAAWAGIGRLINDEYKKISHAALSNDGASFAVMFPNESKKPAVVQVHEITNQGLFQRGNNIVATGGNAADIVLAFALNDEGSQIAISYVTSNIGYVRVYQFLLDSWSPIGNPILQGTLNDDFGLSISLSGDGSRLAVAAIKDDRARGIIRIYDYDGTSWQLNESSPTGSTDGDLLGIVIDLSKDGSRLLTTQNFGSAVNGEETVQMYAIDQNDNSWVKMGNSIQRNAPPDEFYTSSLSLSDNGSRMAVSNGVTDNSPIPLTKIYSLDANQQWIKMGSSIVGDGCFLAGDGNDIVVTTSSDKSTTTYRWRDGNWAKKGLARPGMNQVLKNGGVSLANDGQRMMIYEDLAFNENVGFRSRIRLFQYGNE